MILTIHTEIPLRATLDTAWIDLETEKHQLAEPFPMPTGHPLRQIWQPFAIGLGYEHHGQLVVELSYDWHLDWQTYLRLLPFTALRYAATREFDEMVAKGRFTNARRAHLQEPGPWPHIPEQKFKWVNVHKAAVPVDRSPDIASKDVPTAWSRGARSLVLTHLFKDVVQLVVSDPSAGVKATDYRVAQCLGSNQWAENRLPRRP